MNANARISWRQFIYSGD